MREGTRRAEARPKPRGEWLGGGSLGVQPRAEGAAVWGRGAGDGHTLPSPEEEAILRSCSCSEGSEANWASS